VRWTSLSRTAGTLVAGSMVAVSLAGCGLFSASAPPPHHPARTAKSAKRSGATKKTGPSGGKKAKGTTGKGNTGGSGSTGSGTGGGSAPPPGPGNYSGLTVQVVAMTQVGTATTSGTRLPVWLIRLSVTNPTTAMVPLELNDFSVVPVGAAGTYSYNDSAAAALTSANSLFWPIDVQDPGAHPAFIPSGATVTGDVTVEVKSAAQYRWVWGSPATGTTATTFQPAG
jgi:hypothetical protein